MFIQSFLHDHATKILLHSAIYALRLLHAGMDSSLSVSLSAEKESCAVSMVPTVLS